jgi:hypothetical protein
MGITDGLTLVFRDIRHVYVYDVITIKQIVKFAYINVDSSWLINHLNKITQYQWKRHWNNNKIPSVKPLLKKVQRVLGFYDTGFPIYYVVYSNYDKNNVVDFVYNINSRTGLSEFRVITQNASSSFDFVSRCLRYSSYE